MQPFTIRVRSDRGEIVATASVLIAYPDGRHLTQQVDSQGYCAFELYRTDLEMRILVAAPGHNAFSKCILPIAGEPLDIELHASTDGGNSILFARSTGYIPGVAGRLNPHKDGYVYGDNLAIGGQLATPAVHFHLGEPLRLLDVYGVETTIRFVVVEGQFSLIEYTDPSGFSGD